MSILDKLLEEVDVEWLSLSKIGIVSGAGVDKKIIPNEKSVRLLNYVDIYKNKYLYSNIPTMVVSASDRKIEQCNVQKCDIFFTPSSEVLNDIGKSAVAMEDFDNVVYSYHIMRLRLNKPSLESSMFVSYLLGSKLVQTQINKNAKGLTRFGLTKTQWEKLKIPIPCPDDPEKSLAIQKEIVRILDDLTEKNTALISELSKEIELRKKQYEHYRDKLLNFNEIGGGIEVEWNMLEELIISLKTGLNPRKNFTLNSPNSKGFYVTVREIFNGKVSFLSNTDRINDDALRLINNRSNLEIDDLLFSGTGTIGRVAIVEEQPSNWNIKEGVYVIKPKKNVIKTKFLFHVLQSTSIILKYRKKIVGSPVSSLPMADLRKLKIPVPTMEVQERIVKLLEEYDLANKSIIGELNKETKLRKTEYEYYRNLLLDFPMSLRAAGEAIP